MKKTFYLGIKELISLSRDPMVIFFIIYGFSICIYILATGTATEVNNASIAIVDEDRSELSRQISNAFYEPFFHPPDFISAEEVVRSMDEGKYMFVIDIPPQFERDVTAGIKTSIQVNVDATAMMQASIGNQYITNIVSDEVMRYIKRCDVTPNLPVNLVLRTAFNPNRTSSWFNSIYGLVMQTTIVTVILTGAALIREREHGTIEHLLVMPLSSMQIAFAKIWANGIVILIASGLSLTVVIHTFLRVPIAGSVPLFLCGVALYLFFTTAMGIFLATIAKTMAQFALLVLLFIMPMLLLSGANTPIESQPYWLQDITYFLPSRHFVSFSQAIIYRGADFSIVWPDFLKVLILGMVVFVSSLMLFRNSIAVSK